MASDFDSEFEHLSTNAGIIGAAAIGGALFGFVLQLLVAYFFGAGHTTDAFFMAQSTSELLSKLLMGGSITAVFLPMFVERLSRGHREQAWELALNIFHLTAAIFIIAIALLAIFTEPFVHFIAPGFDAATADLTVRILRLLLPSFLVLFLVELSTSMLQALRRFGLPASLRLIAPLISILSILLLAKTLGIYSLAIGILAGAAIQFLILGWGLHRQGLTYRFIFHPTDPAIRRLLYLVYPFAFSVLVTQGAGIVYRILVSDLSSGSLTALKFAEKITQLLTVIALTSVTTVIYPLLSEKASRKDYAGMRVTIGSAIRLVAFVSVPIILGVIILREPLITFAFQRGAFDAGNTAQTSIALLFLVIGLTTNGISSILGHATLALQQTRAAVAVTIASQAVAIALFILLVPHLAHAGLALASSLVPLSIAALHLLYLSRFIPNLNRVFFHPMYAKTAVLTAALALTTSLVHTGVKAFPAPSSLSLVLQLIVPTCAGAAVYLIGAHLWRIGEMRQLSAITRQNLSRLYALRRH